VMIAKQYPDRRDVAEKKTPRPVKPDAGP